MCHLELRSWSQQTHVNPKKRIEELRQQINVFAEGSQSIESKA